MSEKDNKTEAQTKTPSVKIPTVDELLQAGVHFGHQARRWHPKMQDFIFDKKQNIHIIDLFKTHETLQTACNFLYEITAKGGKVVFVGTKKQAKEIIELEGKRSGAMYMASRWVGGALTNFTTIKKTIDKLKDLTKKRENNELGHYTKKERLMIDREIGKLNLTVGGILLMTQRPEAIFVVDAKKEKTAVREAQKLGIPVVALVDTNTNPTGLTFPIPGNDDAIRSIAIIVKAVADSVEAGYVEFAKVQAEAKESAEVEKAKAVKAEAVKVEAAKAEAAKSAVKVEAKPEVKPEVKTEKKVEAKEDTKSEKKVEVKEVKSEKAKVEKTETKKTGAKKEAKAGADKAGSAKKAKSKKSE